MYLPHGSGAEADPDLVPSFSRIDPGIDVSMTLYQTTTW